MTEVPEKGRDTTQYGRATGLLGWNTFGEAGSVSNLSASECLGFAPEANSQVYAVSSPLLAGDALWPPVFLCVSVDISGYLRVHMTAGWLGGRSSSRRSASCSSTSRSSFRSCRSGAAGSQSRTRSTEIGAAVAGLGWAEATGGANAGRNRGRKQGLAPDPTGGAASRRDPNERAVAGRFGAGRGRCCLDPRRLTVRRQPIGRVRLSVGSSSEGAGLCWAGWSR